MRPSPVSFRSLVLLAMFISGVFAPSHSSRAQYITGCIEHALVRLEQPKKVLILGASFGGGHESSGKAISVALLGRDPRTQIENLDLMDFGKPVITRAIAQAYWRLSKVSPKFYDFIYRRGVKKENYGQTLFDLAKLAERIRAEKPDVVIANSASGGAILSVLRRAGQIPAKTKVAWYHSNYFVNNMPQASRNLDQTFLLSTDLQQIWLDASVEPSQVQTSGPSLFHGYFEPLKRDRFFHDQALAPGRKLVVITGGGEGAIDFAEVIKSVRTAFQGPIQIAVITGKNTKAKIALEALRDRLPKEVDLRVFGKLAPSELSKWVRASDLYVTKGGGNSAPEAFVAGVPVVVVDSVGGHESDNVAFYSRSGLALATRNPKDVGSLARSLLENPVAAKKQREAQKRFRAGVNPHAIADFVFGSD